MSAAIVNRVYAAMERIAPLRMAEKWDNVGLLLESPVQRLEKTARVLLTIDLTPSVMSEAEEEKVSMVVAYHPPIFKGLQSLTFANPLQGSLLRCAAQGISIYSPHTALDSVWGGVNDWLADGVLQKKDSGVIQPLGAEKLDKSGKAEGAEGRLVTLIKAIEMEELESRIKGHLKLSQIQVGYPYPSKPIKTIAICAGSGASMLMGTPADVYFTGEMSHHEVLAAVAAGKHVILCGHTNTERGYLPVLASKLRHELQGRHNDDAHLENIEVLVSQKDVHPLLFV